MKRIPAISLYAIAMGYLEAVVVIYIRQMTNGNLLLVFPLHFLGSEFVFIECGRELATIIMLAAVGYLTGKSRLHRWMYFIFAFAIWDVTYYLFLQFLTGWPGSLFAYDVLFLIPVAWIGPVIAPLLVSIVLGSTSAIVIMISDESNIRATNRFNMIAFVVGCLTIIYSFTQEIFHILIIDGPKGIEGYSPGQFDWIPFSTGLLIMTFASVRFVTEVHQKMIQKKVDK